jgi:glycosyltransferase involved in cell wall biosynthesis
MKLRVIMRCCNAAKILPCRLDALAREHRAQTRDLIVAENGLTDETASIAAVYRDKIPQLRAVNAGTRRGPGRAPNTGAN